MKTRTSGSVHEDKSIWQCPWRQERLAVSMKTRTSGSVHEDPSAFLFADSNNCRWTIQKLKDSPDNELLRYHGDAFNIYIFDSDTNTTIGTQSPIRSTPHLPQAAIYSTTARPQHAPYSQLTAEILGSDHHHSRIPSPSVDPNQNKHDAPDPQTGY